MYNLVIFWPPLPLPLWAAPPPTPCYPPRVLPTCSLVCVTWATHLFLFLYPSLLFPSGLAYACAHLGPVHTTCAVPTAACLPNHVTCRHDCLPVGSLPPFCGQGLPPALLRCALVCIPCVICIHSAILKVSQLEPPRVDAFSSTARLPDSHGTACGRNW